MSKPTTDSRGDSGDRERYWRNCLGRLRLGAEPLSVQLDRHRKVTMAITIVSSVIGAMFITLFSAFRAPVTGLAIACAIFGPIVGIAWLDFRKLVRSVAEYEAERQATVAGEKQASSQSH
jgi:hypothetical protein